MYVDDIAVFSTSYALSDRVHKILNTRFPIKRATPLTLLLGVNVERSKHGTHFNQSTLIQKLAKTAGLSLSGVSSRRLKRPTPPAFKAFAREECYDVGSPERAKLDRYPYRQLVGILGYLLKTRYDLVWVTRELMRYQCNYGHAHIAVLEHVILYALSTQDRCLIFRSNYNKQLPALILYADATHASDLLR